MKRKDFIAVAAYPYLKMYHIKPDGSLIAIEVN